MKVSSSLLLIAVFAILLICIGVSNIYSGPPSGTCYKGITSEYGGPSCTTNAECSSYVGVTDYCCVTSGPSVNSDCVFGSRSASRLNITHPTGICGVLCWDYEGEYGTYCKQGSFSSWSTGTDSAAFDTLTTPCT